MNDLRGLNDQTRLSYYIIYRYMCIKMFTEKRTVIEVPKLLLQAQEHWPTLKIRPSSHFFSTGSPFGLYWMKRLGSGCAARGHTEIKQKYVTLCI